MAASTFSILEFPVVPVRVIRNGTAAAASIPIILSTAIVAAFGTLYVSILATSIQIS